MVVFRAGIPHGGAGGIIVYSVTLIPLRAGIPHLGRGRSIVNSDTLVTLTSGIPHLGRGGSLRIEVLFGNCQDGNAPPGQWWEHCQKPYFGNFDNILVTSRAGNPAWARAGSLLIAILW